MSQHPTSDLTFCFWQILVGVVVGEEGMFNIRFIDYREDKELGRMKGAWGSNDRQRDLRLSMPDAS